MRISATIDRGAFSAAIKAMGPQVLDAANRATERQTNETQLAMRSEITRGLSARAANAYRRKWTFNPISLGVQVVGFTFSAWRRKPRSGGQDIDMFAAYETGTIIRPTGGRKFLAIPLKEAYAVVGARDGGKRPTPRSVEDALGVDLFPLERPGRPTILIVRGVSVSSGKTFKIREKIYRNKRGGITKRRVARDASGKARLIPMFVLLPNVRLPKRLDFSRIENTGADGLKDKLDIELAARGVFT